MKRLFLIMGLVATSLQVPTSARGTSSIEGVWRVTEVASGLGDAMTSVPGIVIFTKRHYSITRVTGVGPRGQLDRAAFSTASAEQLRLVLQFIGEAGTYEIDGSSDIVFTRVAALVPANTPGTNATYSFKVDGSTMWVTQRTRGDGSSVANAVTIKLARVE